MYFSFSRASFTAFNDDSRPTRTGKIMYGNTTTSRRGRTERWVGTEPVRRAGGSTPVSVSCCMVNGEKRGKKENIPRIAAFVKAREERKAENADYHAPT